MRCFTPFPSTPRIIYGCVYEHISLALSRSLYESVCVCDAMLFKTFNNFIHLGGFSFICKIQMEMLLIWNPWIIKASLSRFCFVFFLVSIALMWWLRNGFLHLEISHIFFFSLASNLSDGESNLQRIHVNANELIANNAFFFLKSRQRWAINQFIVLNIVHNWLLLCMWNFRLFQTKKKKVKDMNKKNHRKSVSRINKTLRSHSHTHTKATLKEKKFKQTKKKLFKKNRTIFF